VEQLLVNVLKKSEWSKYPHLCKVPFDTASKDTREFRSQKLPNRVSVFSVHFDLRKERKLRSVSRGELFDIGIGSWFLVTELVAREAVTS